MNDAPVLVFLIAGEPSGDRLGAHLMRRLRDELDGRVAFQGVGGEAMAAEGLHSLFPMSDLSVMGLAEVLPHLPLLLRRIRQTAAAVTAARPAAVVTIDSPDFAFRVARRVAGCGSPLIHYVAPSVWAWKPARAAKMAKLYDKVLALLPFEPPYFEAQGLPCTFVGHPAVEAAGTGDGAAFRARHGIAPGAPVLCLLPGSRQGEVTRLLPLFGEVFRALGAERPGLRAVLPTVGGVAARVAEICATWPEPPVIVGPADANDAFAAASVALAASGTVTLELAVQGTPAVIAYRVHPLTAAVVRRLIKVAHVGLVNLVLNRRAVPELIQDDCTVENMRAAISQLLDDEKARNSQKAAYAEALKLLGAGPVAPSQRAARAVIETLQHGPRLAGHD